MSAAPQQEQPDPLCQDLRPSAAPAAPAAGAAHAASTPEFQPAGQIAPGHCRAPKSSICSPARTYHRERRRQGRAVPFHAPDDGVPPGLYSRPSMAYRPRACRAGLAFLIRADRRREPGPVLIRDNGTFSPMSYLSSCATCPAAGAAPTYFLRWLRRAMDRSQTGHLIRKPDCGYCCRRPSLTSPLKRR